MRLPSILASVDAQLVQALSLYIYIHISID